MARIAAAPTVTLISRSHRRTPACDTHPTFGFQRHRPTSNPARLFSYSSDGTAAPAAPRSRKDCACCGASHRCGASSIGGVSSGRVGSSGISSSSRSGSSDSRLASQVPSPTAAAPEATDMAPTHKPLVVVGSANADIYLEIQRLPLAGETISAASGRTLPGGKGANQAACGARLGLETHFIGQVGEDAYAELLRAALGGAGVTLDNLRPVPGASGHAVVLLQPGGTNSIIIVGGANAAWSRSAGGEGEEPSFFSAESRERLRGAGAVLLQREVPEEVNAEAAKLVQSAGVPVVLDVGGVDEPISDALLSCVTYLSPNETELQRLTGQPTDSQEAIVAAAELLMAKGVPHLLVKLGENGSLLLSRGDGGAPPSRTKQECVRAPEVVDTTGAGDTFTAAFAVGVVEGMGHERALQFASCAASLAVRKMGAMPSLPSRDEVDSLLASTF